MLYLFAIIGILIASGITFLAVKFGSVALSKGKGSLKAEREKKLEEATNKILGLSKYLEGYASPLQLQEINSQLEELKSSFEAQKKQLAETEALLSNAQKNVEVKEAQQQELKTVKQDDEEKLNNLIIAHQALSEESIALEHQLAEAMKNFEEMLNAATLTDVERDLVKQFNEAIVSASGRLRDLLTEYNIVKERLEAIQQQFKDLEEEYTKLVEQQLGV